MSTEIQSALISAIVGLIAATIPVIIAWRQYKLERAKWLYELKSSFHLELYKARVTEYSKVIRILGNLSRKTDNAWTLEAIKNVAREINDWLYSSGGLLATSRTRKAGWVLREICFNWSDGSDNGKLLDAREILIWSMRGDLDIASSRKIVGSSNDSVLKELQNEMARMENQK